MTAHVHIEADPIAEGVRLWLLHRPAQPGGPTIVLHPGGENALVEAGTDKGSPSLIVDDGMALQLLAALAKHYDHTPDTTNVGKALAREQQRVDQLITVLSGALESALSPPTIVDYAGTTTPQTVTTRARASRPASLLPDSSTWPDVTPDGRGTGSWAGRSGG